MRIIAKQNQTVIAQVEIGDQPIYFGRSKTNEVILSHTDISRRHAKLYLDGGRIFLEDLKSTNGTRYQGRRIGRAEIHEGESFEMGPFTLFIETSSPSNVDHLSITAPEASIHTTFAEASTDLEPEDEHTLPPGKRPENSFLNEIAVAPTPKKPDATGPLRGLQHFLDESSLDDPPVPEPKPETGPARLVRIDGDSAGKEIPLKHEKMTIGSSEDSSIIVNAADVSRQHAVIEKKEDSFVLKNHGDSTGTFVDGVPVRERELESHDVVQVGEAKFEFLRGTARSRVEGPRVVERAARRPLVQRIGSDWRLLAPTGLILGMIVVWLMSPSKPPSRASLGSKPTVNASSTDDESIRVTRFHLERASKLISEKKYDEAEARIRVVLNKISPNNPDALQLMGEIDAYRADERRAAASQRKAEAERAAKIRNILAEGDSWREKKQYARAKRIYEQALLIDSESRLARAALDNLNDQEERENRDAAAQKKSNQQIQKLYTEGVMKFEAGDIGGAEKLLAQVASRKGHRYQESAQRLLDEIHRAASKKLDDRISNAKRMMDSGDLLGGRSELETILKQFPAQDRAVRLLADCKSRMELKAKQTYQEGVAYLEVAEDPEAALEKFQETLKYVPDRQNEYYKKAKRKIDELKKKQ